MFAFVALIKSFISSLSKSLIALNKYIIPFLRKEPPTIPILNLSFPLISFEKLFLVKGMFESSGIT